MCQWLSLKKRKDPRFETTKLERAKQLGDAELSVLENPVKNYGQMGTGDLPRAARAVLLADFLKEVKDEYLKKHGGKLSD